MTLPVRYQATAALIVQDPRASAPFVLSETARPSTQDSERYLADQVAILRSTATASRANELLENSVPVDELIERQDVVGDANSNLIEISFTASSPEVAKAGADALARGYVDIREDQIRATADAALAELDALAEAVDDSLADTAAEIETVIAEDPERSELQRQFDEALTRLNALRSERSSVAVGSQERADINAQISELLQDFETWSVILDVETGNARLSVLRAEQQALTAERADLSGRRSAILSNTEASGGGVSLFSPAQLPTDPEPPTPLMMAATLGLLGLVVGLLVAQSLATRYRRLEDPQDAASMLDVPLIAAVPNLLETGKGSRIPMIDDPSGTMAEQFRYAYTAIDVAADTRSLRLIMFVAARRGRGTTAAVVNVACAAAESGSRVLAVDADFTRGDMSSLLKQGARPGFSDLVDGTTNLDEALATITVREGTTFQLLTSGSLQRGHIRLVRPQETRKLIQELPDRADLVLVDAPGILDVAYTTTLARFVEGIVIVVEDQSSLDELRETVGRLRMSGTPLVGYIFAGQSDRVTSDVDATDS